MISHIQWGHKPQNESWRESMWRFPNPNWPFFLNISICQSLTHLPFRRLPSLASSWPPAPQSSITLLRHQEAILHQNCLPDGQTASETPSPTLRTTSHSDWPGVSGEKVSRAWTSLKLSFSIPFLSLFLFTTEWNTVNAFQERHSEKMCRYPQMIIASTHFLWQSAFHTAFWV